MAQATFTLTISRVDGHLFDGEAVSVTVPAANGVMQVLANHEPLITPLLSGTISVTLIDNTQQTFDVNTGTLEVRDNKVTILI